LHYTPAIHTAVCIYEVSSFNTRCEVVDDNAIVAIVITVNGIKSQYWQRRLKAVKQKHMGTTSIAGLGYQLVLVYGLYHRKVFRPQSPNPKLSN
jgi:hypothetical protein